MNVNVQVPAIEKLIDYTASGIGSVAGSMLAPWRARQGAEALRISAQGNADAMQIIARAQSDARATLVSPHAAVQGEIDFTQMVNQRLEFQEEKRQGNIQSVVRLAAEELQDQNVPDTDTNHDWAARFFNEVQDVSSEDMQDLWAKVLAGEVRKPGSTSIRTLNILRNIEKDTATLFRRLCSGCVSLSLGESQLMDIRLLSLGGNAANNALQKFGISFGVLNLLNENGLVISDYNSRFDYRIAVGISLPGGTEQPAMTRVPFKYQSRYWVLQPQHSFDYSQEFMLSGVALTRAGCELSRVVELEAMEDYTLELTKFFKSRKLKMLEVASSQPHMTPRV